MDEEEVRREIQSKELEIQTLEARLRAARGYISGLRRQFTERITRVERPMSAKQQKSVTREGA